MAEMKYRVLCLLLFVTMMRLSQQSTTEGMMNHMDMHTGGMTHMHENTTMSHGMNHSDEHDGDHGGNHDNGDHDGDHDGDHNGDHDGDNNGDHDGDHEGGHDEDHNGTDEHASGHPTGHRVAFYFGIDTVILFTNWVTDDVATLVGSCVGVGVIAALYEGLKAFREYLLVQYKRRNDKSANCASLMCSCMHLTQTLLHVVQLFISYGLMLVFMTFNAWLCLSLGVGAGIGYFLFTWSRVGLLDTDHCL